MLAVVHVLGQLLSIFGATFLLPVLASFIYRDDTWLDFVLAALISTGAGLIIWIGTRRYKRELKSRDGFLLVTLAWVLMAGAATIPLLLAIPGLSFTDAYFETTSGLTTTGSTVLSGIDYLPPAINLWRCALHWFGGMGIIVLALAVLPLLGVGGMQLYKAESPASVKDAKLTPRITETAKALWLTYAGLTAACVISLKLCGISWLDAICHAFSAMGLGGFSTYDASVAHFNSPAVELVLIAFMLIAAMNFARHFLAFRRLSLAPYAADPEIGPMLRIIVASIVLLTSVVYASHAYPSVWITLRHTAFAVVSMASTTGFVTENWEKWPPFAGYWLLLLTCIVCSTGSTGGGIKMFRTLLLWRQALREMRLMVHPQAVEPIRIGGQVVPNRIVYAVLAFIFLYFITVVTLTLTLLLSGLDFSSSMSAVISSINNTGPGLNRVSPATNYASLSDFQTWICTLAMLLGRLEIFSVLVLLTPAFWRK
ncbi:MAG TPA: potassium transporter TrkG [Steroidobacteraceae bacterium]|nr:potassium transporter TrkG [Steroidobacteraceae bacterium]